MENSNKWSTLPFINVSAENLDLANDMLSREEKGELLEMIIGFVRSDEEPVSENRSVNAVFKQFKSVIERKSKSYFGRKKHIDEVNSEKAKSKEEQEVSVYTPKEEQEEETHMPSKEDYINWFNKVKAEDKEEYFIMTYSTYYPSIDEAKGAIRKHFNNKFNRYWLL